MQYIRVCNMYVWIDGCNMYIYLSWRVSKIHMPHQDLSIKDLESIELRVIIVSRGASAEGHALYYCIRLTKYLTFLSRGQVGVVDLGPVLHSQGTC